VDPHVKVFRDQLPSPPKPIQLRAARSEYEPAQLAVRSGQPLPGVRIELSPLRHADGKSVLAPEHLAWSFVGFIPLKKNTPFAEAIRLRPAPCDVPDPLLEARTLDLPARSQLEARGSQLPRCLPLRAPSCYNPGL
jgi:hypothetical protein